VTVVVTRRARWGVSLLLALLLPIGASVVVAAGASRGAVHHVAAADRLVARVHAAPAALERFVRPTSPSAATRSLPAWAVTLLALVLACAALAPRLLGNRSARLSRAPPGLRSR
jgi:hypothetical protein